MKKSFDDYVRLARGLFGVSSLWLGPKEVLYVKGSGFVMAFAEEYVRFELHRIGAMTVAKTRTGQVLNAVYGALALMAGIAGGPAWWQAAHVGDAGERIFWSILTFPLMGVCLISLTLLAINLALGPTCHFQIQTATRVERIRPVRRLRVARRVLGEVTAAVSAAQPVS